MGEYVIPYIYIYIYTHAEYITHITIYKRTNRSGCEIFKHVKTVSALCNEIVHENIVGSIRLKLTIRRHLASSASDINRNHSQVRW